MNKPKRSKKNKNKTTKDQEHKVLLKTLRSKEFTGLFMEEKLSYLPLLTVSFLTRLSNRLDEDEAVWTQPTMLKAVDTLHGRPSFTDLMAGTPNSPLFGTLSFMSRGDIIDIVRVLIVKGYLELHDPSLSGNLPEGPVEVREDRLSVFTSPRSLNEYPLLLTLKGHTVLTFDSSFRMDLPSKFWIGPCTERDYDINIVKELFEYRREKAREEKVAPFIIINNKAIMNMAILRPGTEAELLDVPGVGKTKVEKYGPEILEAINKGVEA